MFGEKAKRAVPSDRFEEVEFTTGNFGTHYIVKDKKTGALYYANRISGGGGGITPLLDSSGKPIIEQVE